MVFALFGAATFVTATMLSVFGQPAGMRNNGTFSKRKQLPRSPTHDQLHSHHRDDQFHSHFFNIRQREANSHQSTFQIIRATAPPHLA
jgi:hypothetical protein